MKVAFLFPGQGAQKVGMGRDLYESFPAAKRVFDQAEAASELPLKKLCFEGPEDQLARTDVCQPAIFAVSAAILAVLEKKGISPMYAQHPPGRPGKLDLSPFSPIRPAYLAGLSLGEYTALYAAGAMDLATAVRLVRRRGAAMQAAAAATPSAMVSIVGLDQARAEELCRATAGGQVLRCANFNSPRQVVLSGQREACQRAEEMAKDFGAAAAVRLKVAGAFHSPLMAPAADELRKAIENVTFADPKAPVIANADAQPYADAGQIAGKLLAQLTSPVRWQQSMEFLLAEGVEKCYEVGPGRVLTGLMRRIDRRAQVTCLHDRASVEKLTQQIQA